MRYQTTVEYLEMLTTCEKCGDHFCRAQSRECPHEFNDEVTQLMAEGKWVEAQKEVQNKRRQPNEHLRANVSGRNDNFCARR